MAKFQTWLGSQYASVTRRSEYAKICLGRGLNISYYYSNQCYYILELLSARFVHRGALLAFYLFLTRQGLFQQFIACDNHLPFFKYFQILYIFSQSLKYFALFCPFYFIFLFFFALILKNRTHALTFQNRPCTSYRSSRPEVFLEISHISVQSLFFNKVAGQARPTTLLKKRLWTGVFL